MSVLTWKYSNLDGFGYDRDDFERERRRLEEAWGHEPPERDVLWALWNRATREHRGLATLSGIYYHMAIFKSAEGEDPAPMLEQSRRAELVKIQRGHQQVGAGEATVIISAAGNGCESCRVLDGKTLPVREALETMPLPNPDCCHGLHEGSPSFCRCGYGVHFEGLG